MDEVVALRSILKLADKKGVSLIDQAALVADKFQEWHARLLNSSWVNGHTMRTADVCRLMKLAVITGMLPDRLVCCFDVKFDRASGEVDIQKQIKKHMAQCPDLDTTIISAVENTQVKQVLADAVASQQVNAVSSVNQQVKCFNCNRIGHYKSECWSKYCSIHLTTKHSYQNCHQRQKNQSGNRSNQHSTNTGSGPTGSNVKKNINQHQYQKKKYQGKKYQHNQQGQSNVNTVQDQNSSQNFPSVKEKTVTT